MAKMKLKKCKLSVNVNKLATLRNSRGGDVPNVLQCAKDLIAFGAEGITVHPRPDGRHIRRQDVYDLAELLKKVNSKSKKPKIEFNIEGYPSDEFFKFLEDTRPDQATLVPDPPDVLTSNAGWRLAENETQLKSVLKRIHQLDVRSSLFVDVYEFGDAEAQALARLKPHRIELYTEQFARDFDSAKSAAARKSAASEYTRVANIAAQIGVEVNAGHDLTSDNVGPLLKSVPQIIECSIGHALITESLYLGFKKTIAKYKKAMNVR